MIGKLIFRDIRSSLGRWFAIFAIIALGAGFLAGLLQTGPAMLNTISRYVRDTVLYDWRVVLPDGIDPELLSSARDVRGVRAAESAAEVEAACGENLSLIEGFAWEELDMEMLSAEQIIHIAG